MLHLTELRGYERQLGEVKKKRLHQRQVQAGGPVHGRGRNKPQKEKRP